MNANIAIPFSNGEVFPHFGRCTRFKLYTIADDQVVSSEEKEAGDVGHEDLALWLLQQGVNVVVCGDIGPGAFGALVAAGIIPLAGVSGSADVAIAQLIAGTLVAMGGATCGGHGGGCGGAQGGGCGGCHCHGGFCGGH